MSLHRLAIRSLVFVVLAGGIVLRFLYLDADPDYYAWVGYISDEGRWVAHARELMLFGQIINRDWLLHLLLAPLFQVTNYGVFTLLGVSYWTTRLVTALSGSALLVLFWLTLRRVVSPSALLVALALLAFEVDLVMLSRVAVPEMPAMLLQLAVYAVLMTGSPAPGRMLAAGFLLLATVAMKATTLPMVAIFSVIIFTEPRREAGRDSRLRSLGFFWAGFLSPLLLAVPIWLPLVWRHRASVFSNIGLTGRFFGLNGPYTFAAFPFETDFSHVFNVWALGVCFVLIGWLTQHPDRIEPRLRRFFVTSSVWYGLYWVVMLGSQYFPDRYRVHILVPMAVSLATGIAILEGAGSASIHDVVTRMTRRRRTLTLSLIALPTAALWAPVVAGAIGLTGVDPPRLRLKLACVTIALLATVWMAHRALLAGTSALRFFFVFPIVGTLGWLLWARLGLPAGSFWPGAGGALPSWWSFGPAITLLLAGLLTWVGRSWTARPWLALIPAAALGYAALTAARVAPSYLQPHYSLKQTSRELELSLGGPADLIASARTEGLFNGNALRYRTVLGRRWPAHKPDVIVIGFRFDDPEGLLGREYDLIATYRLFVSPEYEDSNSVTLDTVRHEEVVKVYRRNAGG